MVRNARRILAAAEPAGELGTLEGLLDQVDRLGRGVGLRAVDLLVGGAIPLYLSCSVIIEEGLPVDTLRMVARTMAERAARPSPVPVLGGRDAVLRDPLVLRGVRRHRRQQPVGADDVADVGVVPPGLEVAHVDHGTAPARLDLRHLPREGRLVVDAVARDDDGGPHCFDNAILTGNAQRVDRNQGAKEQKPIAPQFHERKVSGKTLAIASP